MNECMKQTELGLRHGQSKSIGPIIGQIIYNQSTLIPPISTLNTKQNKNSFEKFFFYHFMSSMIGTMELRYSI
jgi:hypothetical protein